MMQRLKSALMLTLLLPTLAHAWGRRGHQIVNETAAQLLANEAGGGAGVAAYSFDLAYYGNIPDMLWKRPATFALERPQHYMDLDVMVPVFKKHPEVKNPYALTRAEFDAKFPELEQNTGRAFWRIKEMLTRLEAVTVKLKDEKIEKKPHQQLQQDWILLAGVMGHYVGDLGQPMHVIWDYDAEKTNQKGLHRQFEDVCVNYYYPELATKVMAQAKREWAGFKTRNAKADPIEMLSKLADDSTKHLVTLLKIDKGSDRKPARECPKFERMIQARMVASTLILAELYRRNLGWMFDEHQFFNVFAGDPAYVPLGDDH